MRIQARGEYLAQYFLDDACLRREVVNESFKLRYQFSGSGQSLETLCYAFRHFIKCTQRVGLRVAVAICRSSNVKFSQFVRPLSAAAQETLDSSLENCI